ncbi:hypothetical protein N9393_08315 [Luminiphilus sp.]|jgi:hypothetical protein|nr:hypothetical protein [Luminiphilus sp.]
MSKTEELLLRIEGHEKECAVRYEMIQRQMDDGVKRFDKLEKMVMSIYPFIIASIVVAEYFR